MERFDSMSLKRYTYLFSIWISSSSMSKSFITWLFNNSSEGEITSACEENASNMFEKKNFFSVRFSVITIEHGAQTKVFKNWHSYDISFFFSICWKFRSSWQTIHVGRASYPGLIFHIYKKLTSRTNFSSLVPIIIIFVLDFKFKALRRTSSSGVFPEMKNTPENCCLVTKQFEKGALERDSGNSKIYGVCVKAVSHLRNSPH